LYLIHGRGRGRGVSPSVKALQASSIATNNSSSPATNVGTNSAAAGQEAKDNGNSDGVADGSKIILTN
jgi:hypothetical protein